VNQRAVFVVLVNYNGWRDTIECIESVLSSDYPAIRIVVVDNASADGSLDQIATWAASRTPGPGIRAVRAARFRAADFAVAEPGAWISGNDDDAIPMALVAAASNAGFAAGNNVALRWIVRQFPGAHALLLNNDAVVEPTAVSALASEAERDPDVAATVPVILEYHQPHRVEALGGGKVRRWNAFSTMAGSGSSRAVARGAKVDLDFPSGCCMLMTPAALVRVGILDERYFIYCEDSDWGVRARDAGMTLRFVGSAEVRHKGSATFGRRSVFHDYHNARSVMHFVAKHSPNTLIPAAAYGGVRFLAGKLLRRDWAGARAILRGFRDFSRDWRSGRAGSGAAAGANPPVVTSAS
jgi:GT2 family glycosyltransferase